MHSLAPKPSRRARTVSRCTKASSCSAVLTPSTGAASPPKREASTRCDRKASRASSTPSASASPSASMPRSACRSRLPKTRRCTPGAPARVTAACTPTAVSIRGSSTRCGAPARTAASSSSVCALGSTTPFTPGSAQTRRSSWNHDVLALLTRTNRGMGRGKGRGSAPLLAGGGGAARAAWLAWSSSQTASACLARDLASGATASSRSTITASAPLASALAMRSGRSAGTKR